MADLKKKPKHMLVVDDEKDMRDLLEDYLSGLGYKVTCAVSGQDALQIYKQGNFDIILSDLLMKPMGGLELLKNIKDINPDALFIMITGYPSIKSSIEAMKKGASDYITKPFELNEIKLKIERVILEQHLHGKLRETHGIIWALIISIPFWLALGVILARMLIK